jgi:uncharacterized protein (DUF302 family)
MPAPPFEARAFARAPQGDDDLGRRWLAESIQRREGAVKYLLLAALLMGLLPPASAASAKDTIMKEEGITTIPSHHSVDETVGRLKEILRSKDVTLFALIDHSGEAAKAGMKMPPTKLLMFGSPKAGTPLMLAAPSVALDLPLKILVAEDAQGSVSLSYNSPQYLKDRHGLPPNLLPNIAVIETVAAKAAE